MSGKSKKNFPENFFFFCWEMSLVVWKMILMPFPLEKIEKKIAILAISRVRNRREIAKNRKIASAAPRARRLREREVENREISRSR